MLSEKVFSTHGGTRSFASLASRDGQLKGPSSSRSAHFRKAGRASGMEKTSVEESKAARVHQGSIRLAANDRRIASVVTEPVSPPAAPQGRMQCCGAPRSYGSGRRPSRGPRRPGCLSLTCTPFFRSQCSTATTVFLVPLIIITGTAFTTDGA